MANLYEQISAARQLLGLDEEACLADIEAQIKTLLKRWHPDRCVEQPERCTEMTQRILEAAQLIRSYCAHYRFSFREEEVEKYLSPEEWWEKRFGDAPLWGEKEANPADRDKKKRRPGLR
ncbi:MAG: J domain-containing protein [Magnetococcales bacterium]|nr:J domain-containing protein [Magnetococcales bacterium]